MVERARERSQAEGLKNVRFEQADAQVYQFEERSFDIAISRFGVMFFSDPVAAFRNIGRSLRPHGRLAFTCWQELRQNEWMRLIRSSLAMGRSLPEPPGNAPGPFGLSDPDYVRAVLSGAGFADIELESAREPMYFGSSADAFAFFNTGMTQGMLKDLDEKSKANALQQLKDVLTDHETAEGVQMDSSVWLVNARRP
jgi:SAM-dependent methyltransferase